MKNKVLQYTAYVTLALSICISAFFVFLRYAEFNETAMYYANRWEVPLFEEDDMCYVNEEVPIYNSNDTKSQIVGYLEPGEEFSGTPIYPWVKLEDQRGFVCYTPFSEETRENFHIKRTTLGVLQARFKYGGYIDFFVTLLVFMLLSIIGKVLITTYKDKLTSNQYRWLTMIRSAVYMVVGAALIYYVFEDINGQGMAKPDFYDGQIPSIWWMSFYYMKGWALLTIPVFSAIIFTFSLWTLDIWIEYKDICLKHFKEESMFGIIINAIFVIFFFPVTLISGIIGAIMGLIGIFMVAFVRSTPGVVKDTLIDAAEGKLKDAVITDKNGNKKDVTNIGGGDIYTDFEGNLYKKKWGIDEVEKI